MNDPVEALEELKTIHALLLEYGIEPPPKDCVMRTLAMVELLRQMHDSRPDVTIADCLLYTAGEPGAVERVSEAISEVAERFG